MNEAGIRNLVCAIMMQAARDYLRSAEKKRELILKDLRSPYMDMLSNGMSIAVAEQLEKHPEEIRARLRKYANKEK